MNRTSTHNSITILEERIAPLRQQLAAHPLYQSMWNLNHVRLFMESHVFAVWDFMSLLKALQRGLTCVDLPWVPTPLPVSRRFVNEIVLAEESDEYLGRPVSHFEIYLEAMEELGADTRKIQHIVKSAAEGRADINLEDVPDTARDFVETTFRIVRDRSLAAQAAAFAFGREDVIPGMFRALVKQLNHDLKGSAGKFVWYLERHIEIDGEDHGPLALKMVEDLCGDDAALWEEASLTTEEALFARVRLWDKVLELVKSAENVASDRAKQFSVSD